MTEVSAVDELVNALRKGTVHRIGIDGADGIGKTTLADAIGADMGLHVFHLDDYLVRDQGAFLEFLQYDRLRQDISVAPRYIIEGVCLLKVLERIDAAIDALVYVKHYHLGCWSDERELDVDEPLEDFLEKERELVKLLSIDRSKPTELGLSEEIIRYHYKFRPHRHAHIVFRRDDL